MKKLVSASSQFISYRWFNYLVILVYILYSLHLKSIFFLLYLIYWIILIRYVYQLENSPLAFPFLILTHVMSSILVIIYNQFLDNTILNLLSAIMTTTILIFPISLNFKSLKINNATINKISFLFFNIILMILLLLHIIDSYQSPDISSIILIAKEWKKNPVFKPMLFIPYGFSDGFIRNLFIKIDHNHITTQYPIGTFSATGLSLIIGMPVALLNLGGYISISALILAKDKSDIIHSENSISTLFDAIILISPPLLQQAGLLITFDLIALPLFYLIIIYTYQKLIREKEFNSSLRLLKLFNNYFTIFFLLSIIVLIKISTAIMTIIVLLSIASTHINRKQFFEKPYKKTKILILILLVVFFTLIFYIGIQGYLLQLSILYKLKRLMIWQLTLKNIFINLFGLIVILHPILLIILYTKNMFKKESWLEIEISFILFTMFIIYWNSSSFYPFNIVIRYFLPIYIYYISKISKNILNLKINNIKPINVDLKRLRKIMLYTFFIYLLISGGTLTQQEYTDRLNNYFINNIYSNTEQNAIIFTAYYDKLIHNRTIFRYDKSNETINVIKILLNKSIPLYFIPDSDEKIVKELTQLLNLRLVFKYTPEGNIEALLYRYLDYGHSRSLYKIISLK